jgi:hypothetical protein
MLRDIKIRNFVNIEKLEGRCVKKYGYKFILDKTQGLKCKTEVLILSLIKTGGFGVNLTIVPQLC